ncbi:MAG: amidohydrolase family protein [Ilumatobacteraceae bacterium]
MPLNDDMKLISVDDHVIEHPKVWLDRLPKRLHDVAPRVVRTTGQEEAVGVGRLLPDRDAWTYAGGIFPQIGLNAVAGKKWEDFGIDPYRFEDMRPGCYDPSQRLADMDLEGVWAQTTFPSLPGFGGRFFLQGDDRELARLCVLAWNDFMLDEWCAVAPDRFVPLMILPLWDVDASIAEIQRSSGRGAKGISFLENPAAVGLPSWHTDHWDRLFAAAVDADVPLCMHFGSSGVMPIVSDDAPFTTAIVLSNTSSMATCVDLLFSPVFHRHPRLQVALSEGGIGWVPWLLERVDHIWERHRHYNNINFDTRPSDLFRSNIWTCFIDDLQGIEMRHAIGIDHITWESDYPHADSNFPHSREAAAKHFVNVPDDEVHKIVELNARRLFHFG